MCEGRVWAIMNAMEGPVMSSIPQEPGGIRLSNCQDHGDCQGTRRFRDGCQRDVQEFPQHLSALTAFLSVGDCQKDVPAVPLCPHTCRPLVNAQWETLGVLLKESFSSSSGNF